MMFVSFFASGQNNTIKRAGYHSILHRDHQINKQLNSVDYALEMDKKFNSRIKTGAIVTIIGAGLMTVAANYDVPVFGVGQDNTANRLRRERRYFLYPGMALTAVGGFIMIDSFKFNKRASLDLSATSFKVKYSLGL